MLCAKNPVIDACQGDPLIMKEATGFFYQIGIVYWGIGCAHSKYPGVYTSVANETELIKNNSKGHLCS